MNRERKWEQHETDCKTMGIDSISGSQFCYIYDSIPYTGNVWIKSEEIHVKSTETGKEQREEILGMKKALKAAACVSIVALAIYCIRNYLDKKQFA